MFYIISLMILLLNIPVFGFDDFTYDGVYYDNPAKDMASRMGGHIVEVDWDAVESLQLTGPGLGIGLDASTDRAYINRTLASAGEYECGHLYARLLKAHPCALFVHIPSEPNIYNYIVVMQANVEVRLCQLFRRL